MLQLTSRYNDENNALIITLNQNETAQQLSEGWDTKLAEELKTILSEHDNIADLTIDINFDIAGINEDQNKLKDCLVNCLNSVTKTSSIKISSSTLSENIISVSPTASEINSPEASESTTAMFAKELQEIGNEIASRNHLLTTFGLAPKPEENPWANLMIFIINELAPFQFTGVVATSYFSNQARRRTNQDTKIINKIMETGKLGFAEFIKQVGIAAKLHQQTCYTTKLIYSLPDPNATDPLNDYHKALSLKEFLTIANTVQSETHTPFPFSDISFCGKDCNNITFGETEQNELIKFLAKNRHISFLEISSLETTFQPEETFKEFLAKLVENKITSTIRIFGLQQEYADQLENQILFNRRNFTHTHLSDIPKPDKYHFQPVGIPPEWHQVRPKLDNKRKAVLNTQYEVSITREAETITETTTTLATTGQHRITQIENQQQRQQELHQQAHSHHSEIYLGDIITKTTIGNYEQKLAATMFDLSGRYLDNEALTEIWETVAGKTEALFTACTLSAMKAILMHWDSFANGIIPFNLYALPGFFIHEDNGQKILCYSKTLQTSKTSAPLTAKLRNPRNEFILTGSVDQFYANEQSNNRETLQKAFKNYVYQRIEPNNPNNPNKPAEVDFIKSFFDILTELDKNEGYVQKIKDEHGTIISKFSKNNFVALRSLILNHGKEGIKELYIFLNYLTALKEKNLYDPFKAAFIDTSPNLEELFCTETYEAIHWLCALNENDAEWWRELTSQQGKAKTTLNLADCVEVFKYFREELRKLDPKLELPNPCKIKDTKNMPVVLVRLLYILKNAADPKEQLYNLDNVSLDQDDAFYAVYTDRFNFVSGEMELVYNKPTTTQSFSYQVNSDTLRSKAVEESLSYETEFKKYFFRYLGGQRYLYPFETYRKIYSEIGQYQLSDKDKCQLAALVAAATTHSQSLYYDPLPLIKEINNLITKIPNENDNRTKTLTTLCNLCIRDTKPDLAELKAIVKLAANPNFHQLENNSSELLKVAGKHFYKSLAFFAGRTNNPDLSEFIEYLNNTAIPNLTFKLSNYKDTNNLIAKLIGVAGILSDYKSLTNVLTNYLPDNLALLEQILDVLLEVDANKLNGSINSDIFDQLYELQQQQQKQKTTLKQSDIRYWLSDKHPELEFVGSSLTRYGQECTSELLGFLKENAKAAQMLGINIENITEQLENSTITVNQVIENLKNKLSFAASFISASILLKFCNFCKMNLDSQLNQLPLDTQLANKLRKKLLSNLKPAQTVEELEGFFGQYKAILALLENFIKTNKNSYILAFLEALPETADVETFNAVVKFTNSILSDKQVKTALKEQAYKAVVSKPEREELYTLLTKQTGLTNSIDINQLLNSDISRATADIVKGYQGDPAVLSSFIQLLLQICKKNPAEYTETMQALHENCFKSELDVLTDIIKIISPELHEYNEETYQEKTGQDLRTLIAKLAKLDPAELTKLAALYNHRPYPDLAKLAACIDQPDELEKILAGKFSYHQRDSKQFEFTKEMALETRDRIEKITDLLGDEKIDPELAEALTLQFYAINAIGPEIKALSLHDIKNNIQLIKNLLSSNSHKELTIFEKEKIVKLLLNKLELSSEKHENKLRKLIFNNDKAYYRMLLLAHLRELYYLTSPVKKPIFLHSTEIIRSLFAINQNGNLLSGIEPGQGKSHDCAIEAMMLWCENENHTVDIGTADMVLAKRDYDANRDFFLAAGAQVNLIDINSDPNTYQEGNIHYFCLNDFILNDAGKQLARNPNTAQSSSKYKSLIIDEADYISLDDTSQLILSENNASTNDPFSNPDRWIYPLINRFVDYLDGELPNQEATEFEKYFQNRTKPYTMATEILALREYLYDKATPDKKLRLTDPHILNELNIWIQAAKLARPLVEDTPEIKQKTDKSGDYIVKHATYKAEDGSERQYSYAVILEASSGYDKVGATWSNGIQQFVHARRNEKRKDHEPEFSCFPQSKAITATMFKVFVEENYANNPGRILGKTASPGSRKELKELRNVLNFQTFQFPTHEESKYKPIDPIYAKNLTAQVNATVKLLKKKKGQPALIHCPDIATAEITEQMLKEKLPKNIKLQLLTAKNSADQAAIHKQAGKKNTVTLSTISKRGTHIEPEDERGLLVIDMTLRSPRVRIQAHGRTARNGAKGQSISTYNDEDLEQRFGIKLTILKANKRDHVIQQAQKQMDKSTQLQRMQSQRGIDISSAIQMQLDKILAQLETGDERRNKVLAIKKEAIQELSEMWNNLLILPNDIKFDSNNPIHAKQKLNHITAAYITQAETLWERLKVKLNPVVNTNHQNHESNEQEANNNTELSTLVNDFSLTKKLIARGEFRLKKTESVAQGRSLTLRYFLNQTKETKANAERLAKLPRFINWMTNSTLRSEQLQSIHTHQTQHQEELFKVTANAVLETIKSYKKNSWWAANDRTILVNEITKNINPLIKTSAEHNVIKVLTELNNAAQASIQEDNKRHRAGGSRLRNTLFSAKHWIYCICAPEHFSDLVEHELSELKKYLTLECQRDYYYQKKPQLLEQLKSILEVIPDQFNSDADRVANLCLVVEKLEAIHRHPEYRSKESALEGIYENFGTLFNRAKLILQPEKQHAYRIYNDLKGKLAEIAFVKPPRWSFLGNRNNVYNLPQNHLFSECLTKITQPKEKHHLYQVLTTIHNRLAEKFGAYDLQFSFADNENKQIKMTCKIIDERTLEIKDLQMFINIDLKNNIHILAFDKNSENLASTMSTQSQRNIIS